MAVTTAGLLAAGTILTGAGATVGAGLAVKGAIDGPDAKSAKELNVQAEKKAEDARLASAASRKKSGTTKFAGKTGGGIGMSNLKKKAGQ